MPANAVRLQAGKDLSPEREASAESRKNNPLRLTQTSREQTDEGRIRGT